MIIPAKQYKRQYDKYITKGGIPMRNKTPVFHSHTFLFFFFAGLFLFFSLHLGCGQKVYASSWKVTQHGSDSDFQQSMFYTIKGSNGKLIVIDGGWDYDAKRVRDTIKKLGGKVNLWIITHPHPDHVGAFNQIFPIRTAYRLIRLLHQRSTLPVTDTINIHGMNIRYFRSFHVL